MKTLRLNLNKEQYRGLPYKSSQLAMELYHNNEIRLYRGKPELRTRQTCVKAWQRHWRRVTKFNKLFDENLYIPDWYIAEKERENE